MRLVRNFRKSSVPIGKKMPHLRKGKATEYWPGFDKPGQLSPVSMNIVLLIMPSYY